jgi:DNA-binding IscR family transcriptional regulator
MINGEDLVSLDTDYRKNLWQKMEAKIKENLQGLTVSDLWAGYGRGLSKIQNFLNNDLKKYYEKIVT